MTKLCGKMTVIRQAALIVMLALSCVVFSSVSYAQDCGTPTTNGLVGYWRLDETGVTTTAVDSSGNGISGTMQNGLSGNDTAPGVVGTSLTFGGVPSDHSIDFTNVALNTEEFTFSTWVKTDVADCTVADFNCPGIVRKIAGNPPSSTVNAGWYIVTKYGQARASIYDGSTGGYAIAHSTPISDNKWHHVVLVRDAAKNMSIYVDGVLGGTGSDVYTIANTEALRLGDNISNASGGANHQGQIDETRYYNRALSEEEITQLYEYGLGDEGAMLFDQRHAAMKYCNGTDWVHAGLGPYVPNAVEFDGTSDYLVRGGALTDANDTKLFSGSLWFRRNTTGDTQVILEAADGAFKVQLDPSGEISISAENESGAGILSNYNFTWINDTDWHHLVFSFDLSDINKRHIYLDDVSDITAPDTYIDDFIDATITEIAVGGGPTGLLKFSGDLADLWIDFETYIDLSVEANRRKFISASGMPMYLGEDGSLPTGAAPDIFLTGDTENWHTNKGTGGGFTENGALTYSSSRPGQSASLSGSGYFVEGPEVDGNLGGISGAASTCLSALQSSDWLGKATAVANGQLTASNVRPWLCDSTGCQDLVPESVYTYASIDNPTRGGATMTSSVEGYTEDDGLAYENNTAFGNDNGFRWLWTGRGPELQTPYANNCADWTSNSSGDDSTATATDITFYPEKLGTFIQTCDVPMPIVCIVDPPGCGASGTMKYNADFNVMEYCNGTEWVSMGPIGGTPPTDGLVGHWTLDETTGTTMNDGSGNANTGTLNGTTADNSSILGIVNNAINFDATDDYIAIPDSASLNPSSEITLAAWIKSTSIASGGTLRRIISKWQGGTNNDYNLFITNVDFGSDGLANQIAFEAKDSSNATLFLFDADDNSVVGGDGKWHFVAGTYDGSTAAIYLNGSLVNSVAASGTLKDSTTPLNIGRSEEGGWPHHFGGDIDDVRIYDRALSATEIQQLYYYGLSNGLGDVDNGCTSPAANEGEMIYNADFNVMQYCNGEEWIGIGQ